MPSCILGSMKLLEEKILSKKYVPPSSYDFRRGFCACKLFHGFEINFFEHEALACIEIEDPFLTFYFVPAIERDNTLYLGESESSYYA